MKILSVKLDSEMVKSLEDKSAQAGKSPETILADVVSRYIHYSGWQQDLLEFSIEGADHGDFATPEAIKSVFMRWGVNVEQLPSTLAWSGLALRAFRKELEHLGKQNADNAQNLAKAAWAEATDTAASKHAFPGMTEGTLEVQLGDSEYCIAFREAEGKRQIIGVVPST